MSTTQLLLLDMLVLFTYARMAQQFYWRGMCKDINEFVKTCMVCQQVKSDHTHLAGFQQPLPIPQQIWDDLSIESIMGLLLSKGYSVIFVVADQLSKFAHFMPLKADFSSSVVAKVFIHNVVKLHGVSKRIISDRDRAFFNHFWRHLFQSTTSTLYRYAAYHPQTDGKTKSLNKCLELYLRYFVSNTQKAWVDYYHGLNIGIIHHTIAMLN